jgi:hypothetical protein
MYPQYLQRLLRTEAHTDTAYLTGVVVRVRNKTPSFRASFDALFTLATLDNGTTVYTHTPARADTFRADVAALLRGAAARGHVSEAVVVGALSGKPAAKPAKPASKPGKRGALSRLVRCARRGSDAMPGTHLCPMCACCSVVQILTIACAEPGVDQADAMHDAMDAADDAAVLERTDAQADAEDDAQVDAADDAVDKDEDDAMNKDVVLERTDAQADAVEVAAGGTAGSDAAVQQRTDAQADAADDAMDKDADNAMDKAAVLERTDAQADAVVGARVGAAGGAVGGGYAVSVDDSTGRSKAESARKKVRTCLCMASVRVMAQVLRSTRVCVCVLHPCVC